MLYLPVWLMEVDEQCQEMAAVYSRERTYVRPVLPVQSFPVEGT